MVVNYLALCDELHFFKGRIRNESCNRVFGKCSWKKKSHQLSAAVRIPTMPPLSHIEGLFQPLHNTLLL